MKMQLNRIDKLKIKGTDRMHTRVLGELTSVFVSC